MVSIRQCLFIIVFGTSVTAYWVNQKRKGKEVSSLFKMAVGTIIMGSRFLLMTGASQQVVGEALWAFHTGLGLIVLGVGCLKPNISTMVGGLYKKKRR